MIHRIGPRQIEAMAELQHAMTQRAANWLAPGGRLVYAVCSLESAEGEAQAQGIDLAAEPVGAQDLPAGLAPTPDGHVRTDPGMLAEHGGMDGFFIARFRG